MNTLKLTKTDVAGGSITYNQFKNNARAQHSPYILFALIVVLWPVMQHWMSSADPTIGYIDPSIWLLFLLSLICFLIITGLCWWLSKRFWTVLGLPALGIMVLQFKELALWQQLGFYWLAFASLLLAAVTVLAAIC